MKIREDFVTNSSSSSYICCFARISDPEKAEKVLSEHDEVIDVFTAKQVLENISGSRWSGWLERDWAGVDVTPSEDYIKAHTDDQFILIEGGFEIFEDGENEPNYDIGYDDFPSDTTSAIDDITEANGFAEIDVGYGAGRNG